MKNSFVMYIDYLPQIELLTMEQRGILITAIMYYSSGRDLPEMDGITSMAFSFIKSQLDRDNEKYEKTSQARKNAGKMGGRPSSSDPNGFSEKQEKAKKANGFSEKQEKAKKPDNDNVDDNENDLNKSPKGDYECEKPDAFSDQLATIRELYNSVCGSYPRLVKLSEARKKAIRARLRVGYTVDDFRRLFEMAEASDFLKGRNRRNWSATFDWLIADANMAKVLDGNYNNASGKPENGAAEGRRGSPNRFRNFEERQTDYDAMMMQEWGGDERA